MNSCVLMATITSAPELRYVKETEIPFTQMTVEFPSQNNNEQTSSLRVVAWRELAEEVKRNYHQGDKVIIVGRLTINTPDKRDEYSTYKEKRAELTVSQIYPVSGTTEEIGETAATTGANYPPESSKVVSMESYQSQRDVLSEEKPLGGESETDLDDMPF